MRLALSPPMAHQVSETKGRASERVFHHVCVLLSRFIASAAAALPPVILHGPRAVLSWSER